MYVRFSEIVIENKLLPNLAKEIHFSTFTAQKKRWKGKGGRIKGKVICYSVRLKRKEDQHVTERPGYIKVSSLNIFYRLKTSHPGLLEADQRVDESARNIMQQGFHINTEKMNNQITARLSTYPKQLQYTLVAGLLLLYLVPQIALAQNKPFQKEFYIGAKGGMTFGSVKFKPNVEQNMFSSNTAGLLFRMISEPHVGIQTELNYLQKGWQEKPLEGSTQQYWHKLNYLEIPVMTHASLGNKGYRFTFNLGPSVAFLLSDSQGMNPAEPGIPADPLIPYWGQPIDLKVDFLFTGGVGSEFHFKRAGAISVDARVYYSLTNLYDTDKYAYDPSLTKGIQVTLAYIFRMNPGKQ
jgi:hypothetical protein